jgi:hypothetical protein
VAGVGAGTEGALVGELMAPIRAFTNGSEALMTATPLEDFTKIGVTASASAIRKVSTNFSQEFI